MNSFYRKEIPVKDRKILVKEGYLCNGKGNSCYRKEIPFTRRIFLLEEGHSCYMKANPATGRTFLVKEAILLENRKERKT